jgi:hypothetical protein
MTAVFSKTFERATLLNAKFDHPRKETSIEPFREDVVVVKVGRTEAENRLEAFETETFSLCSVSGMNARGHHDELSTYKFT